MKRLLPVIIILTSCLFSACLEANNSEKLLDYYLPASDIQSNSFSANDTNELIVIIYGGTFITNLDTSHFLLTKINKPVVLPTPSRNGDSRVTFRFNPKLEDGDGYRLTVMADAILPGDFTRTLVIQTVSD